MSDNKEKRTEISELGEFALIDRIAKKLPKEHPTTLRGVGDDAAVIKPTGEKLQLLSSDMLLEGIHFDLSYVPLQHLGFKAISVNVSDIAAMNGVPTQATVNLGLSNRFSVEAIEAIYEGIRAAATQFNLDIVGGDTTSSSSGLVLSVSILGEVSEDEITYRDTAGDNDIVCVTGDLGAAYIGLQVMEREKQEFLVNPQMQPQLDKYEYIVGKQLRPIARMDVIHELRSLGVRPTSMIDVSDGLVSDIFQLCKSSGLGVSLYEDKIPIDSRAFETAAEFNIDPNTCALNGGEDYELLFTIGQDDYEKIKHLEDISPVGYMHPPKKGKVLVTRSENVVELKAQGWAHF